MQHLIKATQRTEAVAAAIQEATNLPDWMVYLITDDAVSMEAREINQVIIPYHVNLQNRLKWLTILPAYVIAPSETRQLKQLKQSESKYWRNIQNRIIRAPWLIYQYLSEMNYTRTVVEETIANIEDSFPNPTLVSPPEFKYEPSDL